MTTDDIILAALLFLLGAAVLFLARRARFWHRAFIEENGKAMLAQRKYAQVHIGNGALLAMVEKLQRQNAELTQQVRRMSER